MKSLLKLFPLAGLIFLAACKKDSPTTANLTVSGFSAQVFATGEAISIYGTGFDPDPTKDVVLFNGTPGEVATASPNRLQVIVPLLIDDGQITVQANGQTAISKQTYSIVNVLQGNYSTNFILTPDKKYLLRGDVLFSGKLIIQAGTVIYGEKLTQGSLTAYDIDFEGTAAAPIVFTSDQAPGGRAPGDWKGISLITPVNIQFSNQQVPLGQAQYVRVEYAGFHLNGSRGVAINIVTDVQSTIKYFQAVYSSGDGFDINTENQSITQPGFVEHLVAFGCSGDDFNFTGGVTAAQFGLGLKDPYNADPAAANGIAATNGGMILSNFTLIGYNPSARNIANPTALTNNAGGGVQIGEYILNTISGAQTAIYNTVVAGSWQAGYNLYGQSYAASQYNNDSVGDWAYYEDSIPFPNGGGLMENIFRYGYVTGTAPALFPYRGGVFTREDAYTALSGFTDVSTTPQAALFGVLNDTTRRLDLIQGFDDLGIKGLADYNNLTHPSVLPAAGSPLFMGALFPSTTSANTPLLNKDITYVGAFGTVDWTASWCNFNPQQTQY